MQKSDFEMNEKYVNSWNLYIPEKTVEEQLIHGPVHLDVRQLDHPHCNGAGNELDHIISSHIRPSLEDRSQTFHWRVHHLFLLRILIDGPNNTVQNINTVQ